MDLIVVTIERWPGGDPAGRHPLQQMHIRRNEATLDTSKADYWGELTWPAGTREGAPAMFSGHPAPKGEIWHRSHVAGFSRRRSPAELVHALLDRAVGGGR